MSASFFCISGKDNFSKFNFFVQVGQISSVLKNNNYFSLFLKSKIFCARRDRKSRFLKTIIICRWSFSFGF